MFIYLRNARSLPQSYACGHIWYKCIFTRLILLAWLAVYRLRNAFFLDDH